MTTTSIAMKVVKHPSLDVKYSVPEADVPRWEAQGWKPTGDAPSAPASAAADVRDRTAAQELGIGLLPVADDGAAAAPGVGAPGVSADPTPVADMAPDADPVPEADPTQ